MFDKTQMNHVGNTMYHSARWLGGIMVLFLFVQVNVVCAGVPKKEDIPRKYSEIELIDTTPMFNLTREQKQKGYIIFKRPSVEIVFAALVPKEDEVVTELSGFATPGEYEPVTFCVRTLRELKGVAVKVTDLKSETGKVIEAGNIAVGSVRAFYRRAMEGRMGYYYLPSIIEERAAVDIPSEVSHRFWLTVKVPDGATVGIYTGKISFVAANAPATEIILKFRVLPFKLVEIPQGKMFGYGYNDSYLRQTRGYAFKDMREYGATFVRLGFLNCLSDRNDFSNVTYDGEKVTLRFDGTGSFEQCMEEYRKNNYPASHLIYIDFYDVQVFASKYGAFGSEGYKKAFKATVQAVSEYGKKKGWPEIYWAFDEIGWGENPQEQINNAIVVLKILKDAGVKTAMTGAWEGFMNSKEAYPLIDLFIPNSYMPLREKVDKLHAEGKKVGCYNYDESDFFPEIKRFFVGFLSWSRDIDVAYTWAYQNSGDLYDDFKCFGWNSRYPKQNEEVGGPSTGFVAFREGIDDHRYLVTLEDAMAELRKSNRKEDKQLLSEIQQELDEIIASIKPVEQAGGMYNGQGEVYSWKTIRVDFKTRKLYYEGPLKLKNGWALDNYDKARWKVAQLIMRAKKLEDEKETVKKKASSIKPDHLLIGKITLPPEPYSQVIEKKIIKLPIVSDVPVIDGRLDDEVWKQALNLSNFRVLTGKGDNLADVPAVQQTEVYVLCDEHNMYIGYRCEEKDMPGLKVKVNKNNDPDTWQDDCAEIFIDPDFTWQNKVHLMVNANGFHHIWASPVSWNIKSNASHGKDYWMLEIAVPIKELKEQYGLRWGINFARERQDRDKVLQDREMSSWCYGVFGYRPDNFNVVSFERSFLVSTRLDGALLGENKAILKLSNTEKGKVDLTVGLSLKAGKEEMTFSPTRIILQTGEEKQLEYPFTLLAAGNYRVTATITNNVTAKVVEELTCLVPFKEMLQLSMLGARQYLNESKLQVEVGIMATLPILKESVLKLKLCGSDGRILREATVSNPAERSVYTLNTGGLLKGKYKIGIELVKGSKILAQQYVPLDKQRGPVD